jgi:hypothetical protein
MPSGGTVVSADVVFSLAALTGNEGITLQKVTVSLVAGSMPSGFKIWTDGDTIYDMRLSAVLNIGGSTVVNATVGYGQVQIGRQNSYTVRRLLRDAGGWQDNWVIALPPSASAISAMFGSSSLGGAAILSLPSARYEHEQVISAVGVTPSSRVTISLQSGLDSDENTSDLLDLITMAGIPATDQITVTAQFSAPTQGPVLINWSAA